MPRSISLGKDPVLLEAALEGLEIHKQRIEDQIRQIRVILGRNHEDTEHKRRDLSPAARKRIGAAQKRRWAEYRKNSAAKERLAG